MSIMVVRINLESMLFFISIFFSQCLSLLLVGGGIHIPTLECQPMTSSFKT